MWLLWNLFDLAGTLSFAVSGAIVGAVKRMDIFGISVLAILTAVGGGMIRDVLSGHIPPAALRNPVPIGLALLAAIVTSYCISSYRLRAGEKFLNLLYIAADTIGLASFTVTGTMVGLSDGGTRIPIFFPVVLGTFNGSGRWCPAGSHGAKDSLSSL